MDRAEQGARQPSRAARTDDRSRASGTAADGKTELCISPDIEKALKEARVWSRFKSFPPLYQRVRAYNVQFFRKRDEAMYDKALRHLIAETKAGRMYGEWNDYGRLTENDE